MPPCRAIQLGCGLIVAMAVLAGPQHGAAQPRQAPAAGPSLRLTAPLLTPVPVAPPMPQPRPATVLPSLHPAPTIRPQPSEPAPVPVTAPAPSGQRPSEVARTFRVPSIIGDSPAQAGQVIASSNLVYRQAEASSRVPVVIDCEIIFKQFTVSPSPDARVSRQYPAAGQDVRAGTTVEAWFEAAPLTLVAVPSIIGDSSGQAERVVAGAHLVLRQAAETSSADARVARQCPAAGGRVQAQTVVEAWFEAPATPLVLVPSIIGDSPAQAGQAVAGAHLALKQATEASSATARVSRQSPSARTPVKAGSDVEAWFEVTVPSIVGDTPEQAREVTKGANLTLQPNGGSQSDARASRQAPSAGERVAVGASVTAWFEAPATPLVLVPSIVGDSPAQAVEAVAGAHLALKQATGASSATARVSRQSPSAGTQVKAGTDVEAWFEVTVPSIIGDSAALAKQATAGASLILQSAGSEQSAGAQVTRQSPTAGERVAARTTVTAWFAAPETSTPGKTAPSGQPPMGQSPVDQAPVGQAPIGQAAAPTNRAPTAEGNASGSAPPTANVSPNDTTPSPPPPDSPWSQAQGSSGSTHQPEPAAAPAAYPPAGQAERLPPPSSNPPGAVDHSVIDSSPHPGTEDRDGSDAQSSDLTSAVTARVVNFSSIALTLAFAALGCTVQHRRLGRRSRHLARWQVVARSDPGRQSISVLDTPAGPVLGLRVVHADRAVELSWVSKEVSHV
jgi:beta-lactam-binding protein with PASTA domain